MKKDRKPGKGTRIGILTFFNRGGVKIYLVFFNFAPEKFIQKLP